MRIKPHLNGVLLYVCQISLTSRFQPKPSHFVSLHDTFRFCDYRTTVFMNTVIAAVLVKPKSSHIISKFFLRLSSTLIDNVDCAILDTFNIINTNIIHCIDNNNTSTPQKSNKRDYSTIPTCPKFHAFPKHKHVLVVDDRTIKCKKM